jgi:hypothetical protein
MEEEQALLEMRRITCKWRNPTTGIPLRLLDLDNIRTQVCQ